MWDQGILLVPIQPHVQKIINVIIHEIHEGDIMFSIAWIVFLKSLKHKSKFDISVELSTKTIKRLYYYSVTVFDLYSNLGVIEVVLKKLF